MGGNINKISAHKHKGNYSVIIFLLSLSHEFLTNLSKNKKFLLLSAMLLYKICKLSTYYRNCVDINKCEHYKQQAAFYFKHEEKL